LIDIANKYGKTPAQIVLRSTLQRGIGVIPKTSHIFRLIENYDSWSIELTEDEMKKIRALNRSFRVCDGNLFKTFCNFD
jgi:diketogulonate reductase-like aldo/keto reductase